MGIRFLRAEVWKEKDVLANIRCTSPNTVPSIRIHQSLAVRKGGVRGCATMDADRSEGGWEQSGGKRGDKGDGGEREVHFG